MARSERLHPIRLATGVLGLGLAIYALLDHPLYGGGPGFGATQGVILAAGVVLIAGAALASLRRCVGLFVLSVVGLLMLGLVELVAETVLGPFIRAPYRYEPTRLFELRPGAEGAVRMGPENGGHVVFHRINEDGFRGPELLEGDERPRVMVYGDSFIHAIYAREEETFVRQLEAKLSEAIGPVEVVNAGVSSYGPDQILLRLEDDLERYRPDAVLVAIFAGNDYGDLLRNKLFRLDEEGELVEASPRLADHLKLSFRLSEQNSALVTGLRSLLRRLRGSDGPASTDPYQLVEAWRESALQEYQSFVVEEDPVVTNIYADYYSADLATDPELPSSRYKARLMKAVLREIARTAEARSVPLGFVAIPHPMDVVDGYEATRVDRSRHPAYDGRNLIEPLVEAGQEAGVPVIDLHAVFSSAEDPRGLYLKGLDDHWNPAGQALGAQAAASLMLEQGWLEE